MSQPGKSEMLLNTGGAVEGDGTETTNNNNEQATQGQFGGFNSVEELVAAYEAAKTAPKGDEGDGSDEGEGTGKPGTITDDEAVSDALKGAGLDQDVYTREFEETGTLSEDSFKQLESAGYSKQTVDVYLDGLRARQAAYSAKVFAPAGGEKGYNELLSWAKSGLNDEEKRIFNEAVASGDAALAAMAVRDAVSKRGTKGVLLNGKQQQNINAGPQPFQSQRQITDAMRDPRYKRDPAYRAEIAARLRVTPM